MPKFSKLFVFTFLTVLLSGCKISATVVEGGTLWVVPSENICEAGNICIYEVTHTDYWRHFIAHPNAGWVFDRWQAGDSFLCGDRRLPICIVSLRSLEEETAEKIISSSETAYIMPIFRRAKDIIEVDGKEWYQPYLFVGLSWNEINDVCPDGTCTGMLNGQDMTGWTWASVKDMNDLFNYYFGWKRLGPGPDSTKCISCLNKLKSSVLWGGFAPTSIFVFNDYVRQISGWTKNGLNTVTSQAFTARWEENSSADRQFISTQVRTRKDYSAGAWFYRLP